MVLSLRAILFSEIASIVGFYRLHTTSYHPQTNGMVKCAHRTMKTTIMTRKKSWLDALPIILMGIHATPNSSNTSPFFAVTGTHIMIPQLLVVDTNDDIDNQIFAKELQRTLQPTDKDYSSVNKLHQYIPDKLKTCKSLCLRVDSLQTFGNTLHRSL